MADVFISYKSERRTAVGHLARVLENHGYSVWFDYGLLSGRDFGRQIEREVRAARATIVLWCPLSINSEWVLEEATMAKGLGTLLPVLLASTYLPLGFQRVDTIDLRQWDGGPRSHLLDRLIEQIVIKVGREPTPQYRAIIEQERQWRHAGPRKLSDYDLDETVESFQSTPRSTVVPGTSTIASRSGPDEEQRKKKQRQEDRDAEAEQARIDALAESERQAEAERLEKLKREAAEAEQARIEALAEAERKANAERLEKERLEEERQEAEARRKAEAERIEQERRDAEAEKARLELLEAQRKAEEARLEKQRLDKEQQERDRIERERLEQERRDAEAERQAELARKLAEERAAYERQLAEQEEQRRLEAEARAERWRVRKQNWSRLIGGLLTPRNAVVAGGAAIALVALTVIRNMPEEASAIGEKPVPQSPTVAPPKTAPTPGKWLIGEWVIDQAKNKGCNQRLYIRRGNRTDELIFTNPALAGLNDPDRFKLETENILTTSTWRYTKMSESIIKMESLRDSSMVKELTKCAS